MSLLEAVKQRRAEKMAETPPTYMSSALKGKKYDRPLTKEEEASAKLTPFEITKSSDKQKVYLYERSHTPKGKVERVGLGRRRKTRRRQTKSKRTRKH
jgi:hypothetical protein